MVQFSNLIITGTVIVGKLESFLKWFTLSGSLGSFQSTYSLSYPLMCDYATSYTLVGGALPVGVTLGSNGLLYGTPSIGQDGVFNFTVQANGDGYSLSRSFSMTIFSSFMAGRFDSARFDENVFA